MTQERLRYETMFLDFHGTFTCHRGRIAHALNNSYRQILGRNITRSEFQTVFNRDEGISVTHMLDNMINGELPQEQKELLIQVYRNQEKLVYVPKHIYLMPLLQALGARCIIVTNGEEKVVKELSNRWKFSQYIDQIYGRGEGTILAKYQIPKKPSPQTLDFIIADLRNKGYMVRREKTLMLGDNQHDIAAGNSVGIHTAFLVLGPNQMPEYYQMRPTYALLDLPTITPSASEWLKRENVYSIRDLPKIVSGEI